MADRKVDRLKKKISDLTPESVNDIKNFLNELKYQGFSDLREFIAYLESRNDLVRVQEEVDPELEVNAILDRLARKDGPAVLFENVKGSTLPILGNVFGAWRRVSWAFASEDFNQLVKKRSDSLATIVTGRNKDILLAAKSVGFFNKIRNLRKAMKATDWRKSYAELRESASMLPIQIPRKEVPCKEIILTGDDIDLNNFPLIKCWPQDGGKYMTLPLVITRDPETRGLNLGIYRMMQIDKDKLCIHWLPQKHGNRHHSKAEANDSEMDVVVAIGGDPALEMAGVFQLMPPVDEFMVAGMMKGSGIKYAIAEDSDLWIPAGAEIVFEGVVKPGERVNEGPFGEFNGFYSPVKQTPVFHVRKITMRRDAIWHAATTGMPITEIHYMSKAMERLATEMAKIFFPNLVDINLTYESGTLYTMVVSITKSRIYEAQEIMHFLWSFAAQSPYVTNLVVVDDKVDVHNLGEVFDAICRHARTDEDFIITPRGLADLEKPTTSPRGVGARLGVDATEKWPEEGIRDVPLDNVEPNSDIVRNIKTRWKEYGESIRDVAVRVNGTALTIIVSLKKQKPFEAKNVINYFREMTAVSNHGINVIVVDDTINVNDVFRIFWAVSVHVRPESDVYFPMRRADDKQKDSYGFGMDATTKRRDEGMLRDTPDLIKMDKEIEEKVTRKWHRYGFS
ncbi:MAG: UbiD family decarboxylase [Spirochaetota bacterium]